MPAQAPAAARLALDDVSVVGLTDWLMPFPFPAARVFPTVPAEAWPALQQRYPAAFADPATLMGRVTCFLVRWAGRTLLVDTGLGPDYPAPVPARVQGQLLADLQRQGVAPDDVDTVFLTHLDEDHIGWNTQPTANGRQPTFPNARYVLSQAAWAQAEQQVAARPDASSRLVEQLVPLQRSGRLALITGETELAEGVRAIPTPGHAPGHMSLELHPRHGRPLLILGDAFYHPLQLSQPTHHAAMDRDPETANATRARLLDRIAAEDMLIAACHFPEAALGRVVREGGQRHWQPAA